MVPWLVPTLDKITKISLHPIKVITHRTFIYDDSDVDDDYYYCDGVLLLLCVDTAPFSDPGTQNPRASILIIIETGYWEGLIHRDEHNW